MDPAQLAKVVEVLKKNNSGIIALQNNPSYDGAAAGLALYLALSKLNKHVSIVCSQIPKFDVVGTEKIQTAFAPSGNHLVISFPYTEGAIDKVDYNITGDSFNLIISPNSDTAKINPKDVKFSYTGGKIDYVVTVDVPNLNSLGTIHTENQAEFQGKTIVNIDRHLINNNFGAVNLVNKQISSTSELIYQVIRELGIEIDKDISTNLYNGILSATNNFSSYSVNQQTFEAAAELMKSGAIKKQVVQPKPPGFAPPPAPGFGNQGGFGNVPGMPAPTPFGGGGPGFGMGQQPAPQFPYMPPAAGMDDFDDPYDDFDDNPMAVPPMIPPNPLTPPRTPQTPPNPGIPPRQPMPPMNQPRMQQPMARPPFPQQPIQPQTGQQQHPQPQAQQQTHQPVQSQPTNPPQQSVQNTQQPNVQQPQSRNPQDWLKPKLFRGNDLI